MAIMAKQAGWPWLALAAVGIGLWVRDELVEPEAKRPAAERNPSAFADWERHEGCQLVADSRNDGDHFKVRFPDGRVEELRLYFVDAPEVAFRRYGGGRDNHERIAEQAAYFGIAPERAVELGKRAKRLVESWLVGESFAVVTRWDDPFGDERYHAFVEMPGGSGEWLHERLTDEGLVRIHTVGADLPDGTSRDDQQRALRQREETAREKNLGAWGAVP